MNGVMKMDLKAGDHIYSWRAAYFIYAHHGIYVGDDKVIHFTRRGQFLASSSGPARARICPNCGASQDDHGVVISCLNCFLAGGHLYRYEYAVSPLRLLSDVSSGTGTCTTAVSDQADVVVHRAKYSLQNGFAPYDVLMNNCEDFAKYCKTGRQGLYQATLGQSGQAASCWIL